MKLSDEERAALLTVAADRVAELETRSEREWNYYSDGERAECNAEAVILRNICDREGQSVF